ncbi:hypothetical protein VTN00DRAFT_578 [Thermoascus crustaceus]|uniref:uncharacterized protein n=1 Tax=Thermoascus crustaceus TaxID=5088 RepID=UPI0037426056
MMRPPSPQLLRALRTSISTTATTSQATTTTSYLSRSASSPSSRALRTTTSPFLPFQYRLSSSSTGNHAHRPSRIIPRAHPRRPATHDRGPRSPEETQTDFAALNVLGDIPAPASAIDACLDDGFHLSNGTKVTGGDGVLLVGGEAFAWRPWEGFDLNKKGSGGKGDGDVKGMMVNAKGQWEVEEQVWGLLGLVWPRPDLLILGLGASVFPISPETKRHINSLGIRIEIQDTRNAAAQFNLLATERGGSEVAAALIPVGWRGR